jgi:hypothetical protein
MRRSELEHAIRAACDVAGTTEITVIGSQAMLGQFPDAPGELPKSREVDVFSTTSPAAQELIDGVLGELSQFDQTYGFYVHGVGAETAILPAGWQGGLVAVRNENTRFCTGLVPGSSRPRREQAGCAPGEGHRLRSRTG